MRSYIKKKEKREDFDMELMENLEFSPFRFKRVKRMLIAAVAIVAVALPLTFIVNSNKVNIVELSEENLIKMASAPVASTSGAARTGVITIPSGTVKLNPFLPYRNIDDDAVIGGSDVPAYTLVEPPEAVAEGSDAARIMDTIVSGILYDKFSPSAIINIEGSDYLVKKGDVVNNYKVLCIAQDSVTVQLGENTYKAGIGEILTEGTLNHNDVSNLNNKFGGAR